MTRAPETDDLLNRMNDLIDRQDHRNFIDRKLATESDPGRRAAWRTLRKIHEQEEL